MSDTEPPDEPPKLPEPHGQPPGGTPPRDGRDGKDSEDGPGSMGSKDGMDAAVRIGVALLALGTVAAVITLIPLFTGAEPFGLWIYLLSLLAPLGLAVLFVAFWQRGRSRSNRIAQASERSQSSH